MADSTNNDVERGPLPAPTAPPAATQEVSEKQPITTTSTTTAVPNSGAIAPPDEPPPAYDSIYGKLKAEREKSSSQTDFLTNSCTIIGSSVGFTAFLLITLILPVAMIVVGALNLGNCPIQRYIPIWMLVAGITSAIMQVFNVVINKSKSNGEEPDSRNSGGNGCLGCFNFAWFIAGNVWVFGVHPTVELSDPTSGLYCNALCYNLAFWAIVGTYIMIGLFCCGCCCLCLTLGRETSKK